MSLKLSQLVAEPPCIVVSAGSHIMVRGSRRDCERTMKQARLCDHAELFARVDTHETQETITAWANETFGVQSPASVAERMSLEVRELVEGLAAVAHTPTQDLDPDTLDNLRLEVADVAIMLSQVAELLCVDLSAIIDHKMKVNRKRTWSQNETGHFQHDPETFTEPGSGLEMFLDRWYLLCEDGGAYESHGFESLEDALTWAERGGTEVTVPFFVGAEEGWSDFGECNALFAGDLFSFWQRNPL